VTSGRCYVAGCPNPARSKRTTACDEHIRRECEICGKPTRLVRDHDHACHDKKMCTKCFRGWLCGDCNTGLGFFYDKPELLRAAATYLERPRVAVNRVPHGQRRPPGAAKPVTFLEAQRLASANGYYLKRASGRKARAEYILLPKRGKGGGGGQPYRDGEAMTAAQICEHFRGYVLID